MKLFICPNCGLLEREEVVIKDQTSAFCLKCDSTVEIDPVIPYRNSKFMVLYQVIELQCPECHEELIEAIGMLGNFICWTAKCPLKGLTFKANLPVIQLNLLPVLMKETN
jgi:predicted RNA-binding Zn-ribbon protein involved in translation (DUF1610 family)